MDAEALKIILDLKEENVLLKKAISDSIVCLASKGKFHLSRYDDEDVKCLFSIIDSVLEDKQKPSGNAD